MRVAALVWCSAVIFGCARPSGDGLQTADASVTSDGFPTHCSNCHGSDESPAPAVDLLGQSDPARRGVGAHRAHLSSAHALSRPVACESCHLVPATSDSPGHMDGPWPAAVVFGGLAVSGGAQPALSVDKGTGDASQDSNLRVTCDSVYCHGATLSGGTATSPIWNGATGANYVRCGACHGFPPPVMRNQQPHPSSADCGSCHGQTVSAADNTAITHPENHINGQVDLSGGSQACNTCHGVPPPAPHVQSSACSSCHDTVAADNATIAKPAQHINGKVDVTGGSSCNGCHGSATNNAPPKDTHGNTATSAIGVGAHQKHLESSTAKALDCADCHVVPSSMTHASGAAEVAFGARSKTGGLSPAWNQTAATCASTWCHGPPNGGGSNHVPMWTKVGSGQAACGTCHGVPPPAPHVQSSACSSCHDTVAADNITIAKPAQHVDGKVNITGGNGCNSCHGSADSNAPPKDTHGNTATSAVGVGAHQSHLQAKTFSNPIACNQCHTSPSSMSHSNGVVELTWGPLAKANGFSPSFDRSTAKCSNVWCHAPASRGLLLPGTAGGLNNTPTWTSVGASQATCGSCHGVPPLTGGHMKHAMAGCDACHSGYSFVAVNKANHVNGKVDIGGSLLSAGNYSNGSCAPACHGRESWVGGGD